MFFPHISKKLSIFSVLRLSISEIMCNFAANSQQ